MIVNITLTENEDLKEWDLERFVAKSDFPPVEVTSQDGEAALEHAKGSVLCALAAWQRVPEMIEFKVSRLTGPSHDAVDGDPTMLCGFQGCGKNYGHSGGH